jgi:Nickel responsive protein SCO4226-like
LLSRMPQYIDVHRNLKGVKLKDIAAAHEKDLKVQSKYGVKFLKYWIDEKSETAFCLSEAPNREAPSKAHKESHGLVPQETYEVLEGS